MTKKVIFTILWMIIFKLVFFILSAWIFLLIDRHVTHSARSRPSELAMMLMMGWVGLLKISPLIALVLSIYGLLPGTKLKAKRQELP